jgi:hypothetical protein
VSDRQYLADRLALAIVEHGPASAVELARRLRARRASVIAELDANPLFEHLGSGRGSRWRIAAQIPVEGHGNRWEQKEAADRIDDMAERLAALERRVASLETEHRVERQ